MSKVMVAIPFINCYKWTLDCIKSIKTEHDLVILIIDNSPTKEFQDILSKEMSNISLNWDETKTSIIYDYNTPALSVAQSWNKALLVGKNHSDYILICNNDILFHPVTIDKLIDFINITNYSLVTPTNQRDLGLGPEDLNSVIFTEQDLRPRNVWRDEGPDFSCFLVKSNFVDKFGLFDENYWPAYFEDNDAHMRLHLSNQTCARSLTIPYYHYGSKTIQENPAIRVLSHNTTFEKNKLYFKKKWGAEPEDAMDGKGYSCPFQFQSSEIPLEYWPGMERYLKNETV